MMKHLLSCAAAITAAVAPAAFAATLQVLPATSQAIVGSTVQIEVRIADIADLSAPSLGAYDFDISFDAAVLGFSDVTWGDPLLGNQLDLSGLGSFFQIDAAQAAAGQLNLFAFSYDEIALLNDEQAGSFTLFTLTFDVLAEGQSAIDLHVNALGDAYGTALAAQTSGAVVNAVPLPAALPLFAAGLLALAGARRRS